MLSETTDCTINEQEEVISLCKKVLSNVWTQWHSNKELQKHTESFISLGFLLLEEVEKMQTDCLIAKQRKVQGVLTTFEGPKRQKVEHRKPEASGSGKKKLKWVKKWSREEKYRRKANLSKGAEALMNISCHSCRKKGHYKAQCCKANPSTAQAWYKEKQPKTQKTTEDTPTPKPETEKEPKVERMKMDVGNRKWKLDNMSLVRGPQFFSVLNLLETRRTLGFKVQIMNKTVWVLHDTGALMDRVVEKDLLPPTLKLDPKDVQPLLLGNNTKVQTLGKLSATLVISEQQFPISRMVLAKSSYPLIIGLLFLQRFGAELKLENSVVL